MVLKLTHDGAPIGFGVHPLPVYDPLLYASIIAEWDPLLAVRIIDATVQITPALRHQYEPGNGPGVSFYIYRRIVVCDVAKIENTETLMLQAQS